MRFTLREPMLEVSNLIVFVWVVMNISSCNTQMISLQLTLNQLVVIRHSLFIPLCKYWYNIGLFPSASTTPVLDDFITIVASGLEMSRPPQQLPYHWK